MLKISRWGLALGVVLAIGSVARADDISVVEDRATQLLQEITADPDAGIPRQELKDAQGILIVPHIVESQVGLGMVRGRGVYLLRDEKGNWGKPLMVKIGGMSVGAEAGRKVTDLVVLFQTRKAAELNVEQRVFFEASFEFYGNLRGPHKFKNRKSFEPVIDVYAAKEKDILRYSRRSGVMVGVKLQASQRSALSVVPPGTNVSEKVEIGTARTVKGGDPADATTNAETARLLAELTAITAKPAATADGAGPVDTRLRQAAATVPGPTGPK